MYVVSVGKDSSETGFFNVDKPVFNFEIPLGMNLMNKTSISDCYHLIKNAHVLSQWTVDYYILQELQPLPLYI